MRQDEQAHVALPKLYGAPAYARPPVAAVSEAPKPFDPDDLPLEAELTAEEREWISELPARAYQAGGGIVLRGPHGNHPSSTKTAGPGGLQGRPFRLRALAGRLIGSGSGR